MITFEKIIENIESGFYSNPVSRPVKPEGYGKENYVYNEEESVRWNREHRLELENKWKEEWKTYMEAGSKKEVEFKNDLIKAIASYSDLSESQAEVIYNKAWENAHSEGAVQIVNESRELSEFITNVISSI